MRHIILFGLALALFGCSSVPDKSPASLQNASIQEGNGLEFYFQSKSKMDILKVSKKLRRRVEKWIDVFTGDYKNTFNAYLNNGEPYKEMIKEILSEHGLPEELYFLPVIESGYVARARSHMNAVGPWQFIRSTGRNYGLTVNSYVDERRNVYKATQAAAAHLRDLYNIFGSWELALASYNAGINRITGLIIKGSNREFSKLVELGILPSETEDYIPKFMAAVMIGSDPEKYGFKIERKGKFLDEHQTVSVPGGIRMRGLAKLLNMEYKELLGLNLEYKRGYIPNYEKSVEIFVPKKVHPTFLSKQKAIAALASKRNRRIARSSGHHYRVRRGDTLIQIADDHNMYVSTLTRINGISKRDKIYPGQLLKVKGSFSGIYTVRRGDSLYRIARRFGLSVAQVKDINGLRRSRIYPGQKLRVSARDGSFYIVQEGDTLWEIARENNMSLKRIIRMNRLSSTKIRAGQKLKI